jgi:hypothetical protein
LVLGLEVEKIEVGLMLLQASTIWMATAIIIGEMEWIPGFWAHSSVRKGDYWKK